MLEIRLYDPRRKPANWTEIIQPSQFAVFHKNAVTEIETDRGGKYLNAKLPSTCVLFDSFDEARSYCEQRVQQFPDLRCEIFDSAGKAKPPLAIIVHPDLAHKIEESPASGHRKIALGILLIVVAVILFGWDFYSHWSLILPSVIGLNLVFAGLRLLHWGFGVIEMARARR